MKRRANVTIEEVVLDAARRFDINVSAVAEQALADAVERAAQRAAVGAEIEEFERSGGTYDDKELTRIRHLLADVDSQIAGRTPRRREAG